MDNRQDDPDMDGFFNSPVDLKHAGKSRPTQKANPHTALKHKVRAAIGEWRRKMGMRIVLLPSIVGKISVGAGRDRKEVFVGKRGQADDCVIAMGHPFAFEIKSGEGRQSEVQKHFQEKWEASGGTYVIVRAPSDALMALDKIATEKGLRPF